MSVKESLSSLWYDYIKPAVDATQDKLSQIDLRETANETGKLIAATATKVSGVASEIITVTKEALDALVKEEEATGDRQDAEDGWEVVTLDPLSSNEGLRRRVNTLASRSQDHH